MLEIFEFFDFEVAVDLETTQSWYAAAKPQRYRYNKGIDARNFHAAAKKRLLPDYVLELLDELGIPPQKATLITYLRTDEDGNVHYEFSYRMAGNILSGYLPEVDPDVYVSLPFPKGANGRCIHEPSPIVAPTFPEPHFDLEFAAIVPWMLDEPKLKCCMDERLHQ